MGSYGSRSGAGVFLMVLGGWFLLMGTIILFVGELWTSKTGGMLKEAEDVLIEAGDLADLDPALDGKLVHAVGEATTDEILSDPDYDFTANVLFLKRDVRYYQIVESSHEEVVGTDDDGDDITETVYDYELKWMDHPVKSGRFYDRRYRGKNFTCKEIDTLTQWAENITLGAYRLTKPLLSQFIIRTELKDGSVYYGEDPEHPQLGDVRVSFVVVPCQTVSVLACASGDSLTYYYAKSKARMAHLVQYSADAKVMLQAQEGEKEHTSGLGRVMGVLHTIFGLWLILKGLNKRENPRRWVRVLTTGPLFLTALILTAGWSLVVGSLPWVLANEVRSLAFLAPGLAILWFTWSVKSRRTF